MKVRKNEDIVKYNEGKLNFERDNLREIPRIDCFTLIQYIKVSIEILMNMKNEDFKKENIILGNK